MKNISMADFVKIFNQVNVIDIRSVESYNNNHIENAKNISYSKLINEPSTYLNKIDTYYIYCQRGVNSTRICQLLTRLGYKVVNVLGGYETWILNN